MCRDGKIRSKKDYMKLKSFIYILFFLEVFSPVSFAGQFRCGILKRKVETTLSIPRPPDVLILARDIQVTVAEAPRAFGRADENRIRREVEQALAPDFTVNNNNPGTVFRIYVVSYEPDIRRYTRNEQRRVVVGRECTTDKNGKERCTDKYEQKNVPVRYWEADVRTNWRVEVTDSSGTIIDSTFALAESYKSKKELSVNGVSKPGSSPLPDEREIRNRLIADAAGKFTRRYSKTYESLTVDLACGDELSRGNKLVEDSNNARRKDWEGALKLWESAKMKKKETEGDRLYNMAVAYEALAFMAFDASGVPEDADPQFDRALELYQQAMTADPDEKYIRRASERLQISKNNLRRAKQYRDIEEQEELRALELARAEEEARKEEEEARRLAMARHEDDDTAAEKNFRTYVRARFGNLAALSNEEIDIAASYGQERFKLDDDQVIRVIDQEVIRDDNVRKYREDFEIFVAKGIITKNDREALKAIAESLSLTADDIKTVESSYKFRDESVAAPARKKSRQESAD